MPETQAADNTAQIQFWNSPARAWADQHARMDRALSPLLEVLIAAAAPQPGERVLDIGCASGTTVLEWASRVGPSGYVLGADVAEASVARAHQRIAAAARHLLPPIPTPGPDEPGPFSWADPARVHRIRRAPASTASP
jgi:tRNA G46 methylase TrmB